MIPILLIFLPLLITNSPSSLTLSQTSPSTYILHTQISSLNVDLVAHLSDESDWIKQDECTVCDKDNDKDQQCDDKCFGEGEYGVKCGKQYCKNQSHSKRNMPYFVKQGQSVLLNVKQLQKGNQIAYQTVLAKKMSKNLPQMGRINLLNGKNGLFGDQIIIVKDHDKDIHVHYHPHLVFNEQKEQEKQLKKQQKQQNLLENVQIVKQLQGLVIPSQNENIVEEEVKQKKQDNQNEQAEQQEEQQQINVFSISQIKVRDLFQQNNKETNKQFLKDEDIPLLKTTTQLSIKSDKLLLPAATYKKLAKTIISRYFTNKCSFEASTLKCEQKQQLNIQKLQNTTLSLVINGLQVQFPIRALVTSCKQKSCSFLIGVSSSKKTIIIGSFIFNIFAVKYKKSINTFTLYRLNNQWSANFKQFKQYSTHSSNFLWIMVLLIFKSFWVLFKIILYLAAFSLFLNCLYHWKDVLDWAMQIREKLSNKQSREELKQTNIENLKKIQQNVNKNFHKMKDRVQDRIQKTINKDAQIFRQQQNMFGQDEEDHEQRMLQSIREQQKQTPSATNRLVAALQRKKQEMMSKIVKKQLVAQYQPISSQIEQPIINFIDEQQEQHKQPQKQVEAQKPNQQMFYDFNNELQQF